MAFERCPDCGGELASGGPCAGQCPRCVLELGLDQHRVLEPVPERIGSYRVVEVLGRGGMGIVYLCEQTDPVRRRLAVKLIPRSLASGDVLARFDAERQALALMTHPNVARVYDVGETEDGRPYFAMEYIDGEPITQYCDRRRLSTNQRIRLLIQVCRGVQHAHQKGIVHRDLKPANVLVEHHDGRPVPRIIDFGIAKAIRPDQTIRSVFTRSGQFVGTPEYMSPEQADFHGPDVDTRTDVYALGVLLYELLVGALPLDSVTLRSLPFDEVCRRVREEQPSRPSVRFATLPTSSELAARRRTDVSALRHRLRGDLDWITMKALEKDRERRYGSPEELARELERHLHHEPVSAGPPSRAYRMRKFVRRHRLGVAAASVALAGLILGSVAATYGFMRARSAEEVARRDAQTAEQVIGFLERLFEVSDPGESRGNSVTAREILDRGVARIEQLADSPAVQARLLLSIGKVYLGLGLYREAGEFLDRSRRMRYELDGAGHVETLEASDWLGISLFRRGRYTEAERVHREALRAARDTLGPHHDRTYSLRNNLGLDVWRQARFDEAEKIFAALLEDQRGTLGAEHEQSITTLSNLANVYMMQGRYERSAKLLREAFESGRRVRGADHPSTLDSQHNYAMALIRKGRYDEAEPVLREVIELRTRVLGEDHPRTLGSLFQLATMQAAMGRYVESEKIQREVLAKRRRSLGERHMDTLWSISTLALTLQYMDRLAEAEELTLHALDLRREVLGEHHPDTLRNIAELGLLLVRQGKLDEAESRFRERLELSRTTYGETDGQTLDACHDLAEVLLRRDRAEEAVATLSPGADEVRELAGEDPTLAGAYLGLYGRSLLTAGMTEEAGPVLREARELLAGAVGADEREHHREVLEALLQVYQSSDSIGRAKEVRRALVDLDSEPKGSGDRGF